MSGSRTAQHYAGALVGHHTALLAPQNHDANHRAWPDGLVDSQHQLDAGWVADLL